MFAALACRSSVRLVPYVCGLRPGVFARPHADAGLESLSSVSRKSRTRFADAWRHGCNGYKIRFILPWPERKTAGQVKSLCIRTAGERNVDRRIIQKYYRNRPGTGLWGRRIHFTFVAELRAQARDAIIGEASYRLDSRLSIHAFAGLAGGA